MSTAVDTGEDLSHLDHGPIVVAYGPQRRPADILRLRGERHARLIARIGQVL